MAKAGFWLRGAKGKLAGASMGKGANGQTIMREIVTPKNPKTNAQLMQRAIMATVMQAYSAGKAIFDHSFQGKSVGGQNQQRFMSINARHLRALITNDIDNAVAVASQQGRVVAPGVPGPVPALLQVSEGTLSNTLFSNGVAPDVASVSETTAEYCQRLGLTTLDIFTFVAFVIPENASTLFALEGHSDVLSQQLSCQFVYARFKVKEAAFTSSTPAYRLTVGDILELTEANFVPSTTQALPNNKIGILEIVGGQTSGSFTWIRSKFNEDLRSTEKMIFDNTVFGIASEYALAAWKQGASKLGNSELILEGSGIDVESQASLDTVLPELTAEEISAIPVGTSKIGTFIGTVNFEGHSIKNPVVALTGHNSGKTLVGAVSDQYTTYTLSCDQNGNVSLVPYDTFGLAAALTAAMQDKYGSDILQEGGDYVLSPEAVVPTFQA